MKIEDLMEVIKKTTKELRELNDAAEERVVKEESSDDQKTGWRYAKEVLPFSGRLVLGYGYYREAEEDIESVHIVSFDGSLGWYSADEENSMIISYWCPIFDPYGNFIEE